jgi:hypothetical protein
MPDREIREDKKHNGIPYTLTIMGIIITFGGLVDLKSTTGDATACRNAIVQTTVQQCSSILTWNALAVPAIIIGVIMLILGLILENRM